MGEQLILITNGFPYGFKEPFLEKEMPFLANSFEKISIISKTTNPVFKKKIPQNVTVYQYNPTSNLYEKLIAPLLIIKYFKTIIRDSISELIFLRSNFNIQRLKILFHDLIKGIQFANYLKNKHILYNTECKVYIYSYWFGSSAYAISLIKKHNNIKTFARAHGSDLYFYVHKNNYLPFKKITAKRLDALFFISEFGKDYFENLIKVQNEN